MRNAPTGHSTGNRTDNRTGTLAADEALRVLIVSDAAPERNGVGAYYSDLVRGLEARGVQAELVHGAHPVAGGYRWSRCALPGDPTQSLHLPRPLRLHRCAARLRPHVVVVPTPGPFGLAGAALARLRGVPLVVGFHTDFEALAELYWRGDAFGRGCAAYLRASHRLLFRGAAAALANCAVTARQATALGARRVALMGTPIAEAFVAPATPAPARPVRRVLFAGRLAAEKNLDALVELARTRPGFDVTIAGDGPLRDALEREAGALPNLRVLGWVTRARLVELVDACDAFALPSRVESFGTVALEAMARARPVVVSAGCGIADWRTLDDALVAARPGEPFADAMGRLCALGPGERRALGERARAAALALDAANAVEWHERLKRLASRESVPYPIPGPTAAPGIVAARRGGPRAGVSLRRARGLPGR